MPGKKKRPVRRKRHPKPALRKKQRPLETVAEAKRQIATVKKEFIGGRLKFIAYTNLLSRAYAGKQNKKVIELIQKERHGIVLKKPAKEKPVLPKRQPSFGNLGRTTNTYLRALGNQLKKGNFKNCQNLIHILVTDTPKTECGIVASLLESRAKEQEAKFLKAEKNIQGFANTVIKLYDAAGNLYKKRGSVFWEKAEELFVAADIFKARSKFGF